MSYNGKIPFAIYGRFYGSFPSILAFIDLLIAGGHLRVYP